MDDIKRYLQRAGASSAKDVMRHLNISQPVFSRLVGRMERDILVAGGARSTRYALKREMPDVGGAVPIYKIDERGESHHMAVLHAIWPKGFYLEAKVEDINNGFFDDLPYFLEDLRPNGFLGRMVPKRHPELNAPDDIRLWSADHCLKYLTRFGADSIGNFILGDKAFGLYLAQVKNPADLVGIEEMPFAYAKMANDVITFGPAGSSAGGEQPKFLAVKGADRIPVLVKFSPPVVDQISGRMADLLMCEHIAHGVMEGHGFQAAKSEIIRHDGRVFLEIERFDRVGATGRRGLISLGALCAQFAGIFNRWSEATGELARQKIIDADAQTTIRALEMFGRLIANTDMHMANLSFFTKGEAIAGLSPVYDMLPMMYAPRNAQIIELNFDPPLPRPLDADIWDRALSAACDFWNRVSTCEEISAGFKSIARVNAEKLEALRNLRDLLPR